MNNKLMTLSSIKQLLELITERFENKKNIAQTQKIAFCEGEIKLKKICAHKTITNFM